MLLSPFLSFGTPFPSIHWFWMSCKYIFRVQHALIKHFKVECHFCHPRWILVSPNSRRIFKNSDQSPIFQTCIQKIVFHFAFPDYCHNFSIYFLCFVFWQFTIMSWLRLKTLLITYFLKILRRTTAYKTKKRLSVSLTFWNTKKMKELE